MARVLHDESCTAGIGDREALVPPTEHYLICLDQHRSYLDAAASITVTAAPSLDFRVRRC